MDILSIIAIAIGLAMDAFAVSISLGCARKEAGNILCTKAALFFGGFQFLMPILGFYFGSLFAVYLEQFSHWVAFGLLAAIGFKMLYEFFFQEEDACEDPDDIDLRHLLILALATSIDALAVGLSVAILKINIFSPALIIGIITFAFSFIGVKAGQKLHKFLGRKMELVGGIILILIGLRIVIDHYFPG